MRFISGIEIARLVSLLAVVALHASALGAFGAERQLAFLVDELSRFAVPVFFLISGYLWSDRQIGEPRATLRRLLARLLLPFVFWLAVYNGLEFSEVLYPRTYFGGLLHYASIPLTGGPAFHLWFLPALFIGTAIGLASIRHLGERAALGLAGVLYLAGATLWLVTSLADIHAPAFAWRNGWFFAPVFLISGYSLRQRKLAPPALFAGLAVVGAMIQVGEGAALSDGFPHGHDMSFGTPLFAIGVFGLLLRVETQQEAITNWGRDVFGAYLVHLLVLSVLMAFVPDRGVAPAVVFVLATFMISLAVTRIYRGMLEGLRRRTSEPGPRPEMAVAAPTGASRLPPSGDG